MLTRRRVGRGFRTRKDAEGVFLRRRRLTGLRSTVVLVDEFVAIQVISGSPPEALAGGPCRARLRPCISPHPCPDRLRAGTPPGTGQLPPPGALEPLPEPGWSMPPRAG